MFIPLSAGEMDPGMAVERGVRATSGTETDNSAETPTFESLFAKYQPMVYSVGLRYLRTHQDAEDATQEVFAKVWKNLKAFNRGSSLKTWIYRIAINTCIDHGRQPWKRIDSWNLSSAESFCEQELVPQFVIEETAEGELLAEELRSQVSQAVALLRPHLQHVFVLKEVEEMSYDEIASLLGLSMGTIGSRLHRAKKALQDSLAGIMHGPALAGAGA
jgi:RNA polymerase sigma-70 factor (ECF subfamily)